MKEISNYIEKMWSSIVVLMVSFPRKDGATDRALQALDHHPRIDRVLLRGACPEQYFHKVTCLPLRKTVFHKAYESLPQEYIPVRFHCPQGSWCGTDPLDRVRWRTNLNLDALSGLMSAVHDIPKGSPFVWLENDVQLYPERLMTRLHPTLVGEDQGSITDQALCVLYFKTMKIS